MCCVAAMGMFPASTGIEAVQQIAWCALYHRLEACVVRQGCFSFAWIALAHRQRVVGAAAKSQQCSMQKPKQTSTLTPPNARHARRVVREGRRCAAIAEGDAVVASIAVLVCLCV